MQRTAFKVILTLTCGFILIMTITALGLFFDSGKVSVEAISKAESELAGYLAAHPDKKPRVLAVVDYSQPSYSKRMVIIDLLNGNRSHFRVAHGRMSGEVLARRFSNIPGSNMSSLGLFHVTKRYYGEHGLSLRLDGLDSLRNGNAATRDIVLHSAGYVSIRYILLNTLTGYGPMIGRSNACFAVSRHDIDEVVRNLEGEAFLFAWASEEGMPGNESRP